MEAIQAKIEALKKQTADNIKRLTQKREAEIKDQLSQETEHALETHSGIILRPDRTVSSEELDRLMSNRRYVKLDKVKDTIKEGVELESDWVTIAVVVQKSDVRKTKTGNNFMVFTLGDLDGEELSLFLFGEAYNGHWQIALGSVVAVLNALVGNNGGYKITHGGKLLIVGTSKDYASCRGIIGNMKCDNYVNLKYGPICSKHKNINLASKRPELTNTNFNPKLARLKKNPPKLLKIDREIPKANPQEVSNLDKYISSRNKLNKNLQPKIDIEIEAPLKRQATIPEAVRKLKLDK
jgi:DNA polymerase III alpha subunit